MRTLAAVVLFLALAGCSWSGLGPEPKMLLSGLPIDRCGSYTVTVAQVTRKFEEVSNWRGLSSAGYLMELFGDEAGGWTLVATTPGQASCIIMIGVGGS